MPFRLLDRVSPHATAVFGADVMERRSRHAVQIARAICLGAQIDGTINAVTRKLDGDGTGSSDVLDADDRRLVTAALRVIRDAVTISQRFSRWIWGFSPDLDDAIMLIEPVELWSFYGEIEDRISHLDDAMQGVPEPRLDPGVIHVFHLSDLTEAVDTLQIAHRHALDLMIFCGSGVRARELVRQQLSSEPDVQRAMNDLTFGALRSSTANAIGSGLA